MGCANSKAQQNRAGQKAVRGLDGDAGGRGSGAGGGKAAGGGMPRIKMVLLGDSGVGKSCLVLRFVRGQFDPSSKVTVGAAFMSHPVALPDSSTVKFEIWVRKNVHSTHLTSLLTESARARESERRPRPRLPLRARCIGGGRGLRPLDSPF